MPKNTDYQEINLEQGMPTVDAALRRFTFELNRARAANVPVMKLIHGYGSSGTGGKIRTELRRYLERLTRAGKISGFITGESFSIFDEQTRKSFLICSSLRQDRDLDRHNNGVTFVLLK